MGSEKNGSNKDRERESDHVVCNDALNTGTRKGWGTREEVLLPNSTNLVAAPRIVSVKI